MTFETILTPETIEEYTKAGFWQNKIITDFLDEVVARTPDKTAAIDPRRQVTYRELQAETDCCALGLLELGVRPGDVVSFQLPNWIEFVVLHFAATRIGAVSNPLIPIYRDREVGFMVGFAESKVLVVPREFRKFDYSAMVDRLRPSWPALQHVFVVDGEPGEANPSWESFERGYHRPRSPASPGVRGRRARHSASSDLLRPARQTNTTDGVTTVIPSLSLQQQPSPKRSRTTGRDAGASVPGDPPRRSSTNPPRWVRWTVQQCCGDTAVLHQGKRQGHGDLGPRTQRGPGHHTVGPSSSGQAVATLPRTVSSALPPRTTVGCLARSRPRQDPA